MSKVFLSEKDVEAYFRKLLEDATGSSFATLKKMGGEGRHWETDGVIDWESPTKTPVRVLLEAKYNKDLTSEGVRSDVLAQALYYCKKFEERGDDMPNVIFVGSESHCFALDFKKVEDFLNAQIDWSRAPSSPDPRLFVNVNTHLEPTLGVDGAHLKKLCEELAEGCVYKVKPSAKNISAMYQYWVDHIIPEGKYQPVEMTDIFFGAVFYAEGEDNYAYPHPIKADVLVLGGKEYEINISAMEGFFERRQRGLGAKEIDELISMRDRIIEDDTRRRQGAFYTPSLWVDEAHSEMEKVLGANWKDECIVWDCCAGTGNLTRDYRFQNLILSTAESPDVKAMKREEYNKGAHVFQYDFLNPDAISPFFEEGDGDNTLPLAVKKLLEKGAKKGKRLVFLINPPYATAGVKGASSKKDVANTIANDAMKDAKMGACSQQLYAQFLFQCEQVAQEYGFKQKSVGVFCKPAFMTSGSFAKFRPFWYERYSYQSGFMFQASHFADVSGAWGVSFTLWNEGKTEIAQDLPITLKDLDMGEVTSIGHKDLYNADDRKASDWVREPIKGAKGEDAPQMASGLKIKTEGTMRGKQVKGSLIYFTNHSNCPQQNDIVYLTPYCSPNGNGGLSVLAGEGWRRSIALYSARKLVTGDWANDKDEYLAPQTEAEGYDQWVDDCHVYALLHSSNNMTSMRDVEYKGQKWNIHNHLFWLTHQEALDLYGPRSDAKALYRDAKSNPIPYEKEEEMGEDVTPEWRKNGDPYFAHILPTLNLSPLAQEIMEDLRALFIKSLPYRSQITHENGLDLHLGAWDAGIYQHKKLWAQEPTLKADWISLKDKHRQLAKNLEHGVYTFGFLKP